MQQASTQQPRTAVPGVGGTWDCTSAVARTCSCCCRLAGTKRPVSGTRPTGWSCTAARTKPVGLWSNTDPARTTHGAPTAARRRPAPRLSSPRVRRAGDPGDRQTDPGDLAGRKRRPVLVYYCTEYGTYPAKSIFGVGYGGGVHVHTQPIPLAIGPAKVTGDRFAGSSNDPGTGNELKSAALWVLRGGASLPI